MLVHVILSCRTLRCTCAFMSGCGRASKLQHSWWHVVSWRVTAAVRSQPVCLYTDTSVIIKCPPQYKPAATLNLGSDGMQGWQGDSDSPGYGGL